MAGFTFVKKNAGNAADSVTSYSDSITGTTAGNLIVVCATQACGSDVGTAPANAFVAPDSGGGWTLGIAPAGPGAAAPQGYRPTQGLWWKISTGGTQTISWPGTLGADTYIATSMSEWSVSGTLAADVSSSGVSLATTNVTTGPVTPTAADSIIFAVGSGDGGAITGLTGPNSGYTNLFYIGDNSAHCAHSSGYKTLTSASAQGATWSWAGSNWGSGIQVAFIATTGGGGGTAALTGVEGTGAVGTVAPGADVALPGNAGIGAAGTVVPGTAAALSNVVGIGAAGTVGVSVTVALTGVQGAGAVGDVAVGGSPDVTLGLTGVEAAAAVGSVVPATDTAIIGNDGFAAVGSMGAAIDMAVAGNTASGSGGSVGVDITIPMSGNAAAGTAGEVAVQSSDVTIALTGVEATGQAGDVVQTGGTPASTGFPGFEVDQRAPRRLPERSVKPMLVRAMERRLPKVAPPKERAAKRAKVIEFEAAAALLDGATACDIAPLLQQWEAQRPYIPPKLEAVPTLDLFLSNVAFRVEQAQASKAAHEALQRARRQDEDALIAILLA